MKKFDIPPFYQSGFVAEVKNIRKERDKLKRDFAPTRLDFGPVVIYLARHFGFCFGVENNITVSRTVNRNCLSECFIFLQLRNLIFSNAQKFKFFS